uniref:SERTA domain-containing protein n=1 Tax=Caenorhabditis japonica TaxID=281687 RepID=A0A8R1HLF5_CAEJA
MVFFSSNPTSSLVQSETTTTTAQPSLYFEHPKSQPIPVSNSNGGQWDGDHHHHQHLSCSPLERIPSPLATSAESVNSIKSSCSSRSSAERETERAQRRQLLNTSLSKLRDEANMPLRKHLLIYNTVKSIQQDLDMLDDEELYCSLVGMSNETSAMLMEVDAADECCWGVDVNEKNLDSSLMTSGDVAVVSNVIRAPLKQEERGASSVCGMMFGDDLEMMEESETKTWSWSSGPSIFDSFEESSKTTSMDALFKWSSTCSESPNAFSPSLNGDTLFHDDATSSWSHGATGFDMWGSGDLLGASRFEMHNLLLLQA